jgi:hypothetical protein
MGKYREEGNRQKGDKEQEIERKEREEAIIIRGLHSPSTSPSSTAILLLQISIHPVARA